MLLYYPISFLIGVLLTALYYKLRIPRIIKKQENLLRKINGAESPVALGKALHEIDNYFKSKKSCSNCDRKFEGCTGNKSEYCIDWKISRSYKRDMIE